MKSALGFALGLVAAASVAAQEPTTQPASPLDDLTITAAPGGGIKFDLGDDFSLKLKGRIQALWSFRNNEVAADTNNFRIRRARTAFSGHIWDKDTTYKMQMDWTRDDVLLDAWVRWQFWNADGGDSVAIRLGAQKPHHGREFSGSSANLEHVDRSLASRTFTGNRVTGAWLQGKHLDGGKVHWNVGVGNSDAAAASTASDEGNNAANADNELSFFFDLRLDPFGDFGDESYKHGDFEGSDLKGTVGAGLMFGNHRAVGTVADPANNNPNGTVAHPLNGLDIEATSVNIYTQWKFKRIQLLGEVFMRTDDPDVRNTSDTDHLGWAAGASYVTAAAEEGGGQWGFAARVSKVSADDTTNAPTAPPATQTLPIVFNMISTPLGGVAGEVTEWEATISRYYHGHNMKTQIGYRHQEVDFDAPGSTNRNNFFDIIFQLVF